MKSFLNFFGQEQEGAAATGGGSNLGYLQKAINFCLYGLLLLVPLLFLPITFISLDFNKQALLFVGVVAMVGIWVIKVVTTRRAGWVKTPIDYAVLGFAVVYALASFMSIDRIASVLGYYGRFTGSLVSVLTLVVLYFLVVNNLKTERLAKRALDWMTAGVGLAVVYGLLQVLGVFVFRFDFVKLTSFNSVGSVWGLSAFAALAIIVAQWQWFSQDSKGWLRQVGLWVMTLAGLAVIFLLNVMAGWLVLLIGMVAFISLAVMTSTGDRLNPIWYWKPMAVLVVALLFVIFSYIPSLPSPRDMTSIVPPVEAQLSQKTTWDMVFKSVGQKPILGYGPGAFSVAFGQIKPDVINKTVVWNVTFDRAGSEIANLAIETGLVGLLLFELIALFFLFYSVNFLRRNPMYPGRSYAFGFLAVWLTLYITHFFYYFNTTSSFLYWFSLAAVLAIMHWRVGAEQQAPEAASTPRANLSWMFASVLILAALAVAVYFQASIYMADVAYTKGLKALNQPNPNFEQIAGHFGRAVRLNPYRDVYLLAYGQNLGFLASVEAAKDEPNVQRYSDWVRDMLVSAQAAVQRSPNKASNWSVLAQFYNNIRPLTSRDSSDTPIDTAIVNAWNRAIERDGTNPALHVRLAKAYVNASEIIDPTIAGTGADADADGLSDQKEQALGSDPNNSDTNGNDIRDGDEVKAGFNPAGTGRLSASELQSFIRIDQAMLAKAEAALRRADELKPDLIESSIELIRVLERSNRAAEAKELADRKFKESNNSSIDLAFEVARLDYNLKNYDSAEKMLNAIIKANPRHANANYSLGLIYLQRNDRARALEQFQKTREITGPNLDLERYINDLSGE